MREMFILGHDLQSWYKVHDTYMTQPDHLPLSTLNPITYHLVRNDYQEQIATTPYTQAPTPYIFWLEAFVLDIHSNLFFC